MNILKNIIDPFLARMSGKNHKPLINPQPEELPLFHRQTPLLSFGSGQDFTLGQAYEGIAILGSTGSGKTSGSGASLALSFLRMGFGGLILTAKPDDVTLWQRYAEMTDRELTIVGPGSGYFFNFLAWEVARGRVDAGLAHNLAELFVAIAETVQGKSGAIEAYWMNALKQLLRMAIILVVISESEVSLPVLLDIIMSAPHSREEANDEEWKKHSFCWKCIERCGIKKAPENEADFEHTKRYWLREFPSLGDRTRSSIVSMFTVSADCFLTGDMRKFFCTHLNILPEETHTGRLLLFNCPVETFNETGMAAQMLFKHCWQRATACREPEKDGGIPVFLWADEAQYFVSNSDLHYQATARSKRACTVYLSQNLPTLYDRVGHDKANSLLGNLQNKIFHAQGDHVTNTYAADTIARTVTNRSSTNISASGTSFGTSETVDYTVPPAEFQRLRRGGEENNFFVDAYIFQAGRKWPSTGESYIKTTFRQPNQH
jgi:hypothetical protein